MTAFVPIIINNEPDRCPKCHEVENIKEVCCHCGYEYTDEKTAWWKTAIAICAGTTIVVIIVWALVIIGQWLEGSDTLFEVLNEEWEWLKSRRIK